MAKIKSIIEPYGILHYFRWKAVTFVRIWCCFHSAIVTDDDLTCQFLSVPYCALQRDYRRHGTIENIRKGAQ